MGDVLIGPHDDDTALLAIDAPHLKNVIAALEVRTENLFVVAKPISPFRRKQKRGHGFYREFAMALLEDRTDIDHGIGIRARGRVLTDRRLR
jgi:hypothetical protein